MTLSLQEPWYLSERVSWKEAMLLRQQDLSLVSDDGLERAVLVLTISGSFSWNPPHLNPHGPFILSLFLSDFFCPFFDPPVELGAFPTGIE